MARVQNSFFFLIFLARSSTIEKPGSFHGHMSTHSLNMHENNVQTRIRNISHALLKRNFLILFFFLQSHFSSYLFIFTDISLSWDRCNIQERWPLQGPMDFSFSPGVWDLSALCLLVSGGLRELCFVFVYLSNLRLLLLLLLYYGWRERGRVGTRSINSLFDRCLK